MKNYPTPNKIKFTIIGIQKFLSGIQSRKVTTHGKEKKY